MPLERFLPETPPGRPDAPLQRRAALASTLLAGLELEREGAATLAKDEAFGEIAVAPGELPHPAYGGTNAGEVDRVGRPRRPQPAKA